MINRVIIVFVSFAWSLSVLATEISYPYKYEGKVKGMVCAFCVYNVSKK